MPVEALLWISTKTNKGAVESGGIPPEINNACLNPVRAR